MSPSALISILHLSDFHYAKKRLKDQKIVVDALIADLNRLCVGHRRPDIIVFTGDLVHAAGIDLHDEAYDFFIDKVSKATGCSDERIFIAAGNHDVCRSGLELFSDDLTNWRSVIGQPDEAARFNEYYANSEFDASIKAKFSQFIDLDEYISGSDRGGITKKRTSFYKIDYIKSLNIEILTFNSSVFSSGGHKSFGSDKNNLVIPEHAVFDAVDNLTPGSFRVVVTHHPLDWFSEACAKYLESAITRNGNLHLFGHMHDPQPRHIVGLRGRIISDQSGAIYTSRTEYYNGFSLITLDPNNQHTEINIRSYFKDRNEFDVGVDVVEDGRWYPSQEARQHYRKIAAPVDLNLLRGHLCGAALDALKARELASGNEAMVHNRFIAPPLYRTYIRDGSDPSEDVEAETKVDFADVVAGDGNLAFYAKAEYGRTTLLQELRFRLLSEATSLPFPRLPALIDFSLIGGSPEHLLRLIKGAAEASPDSNNIESLLRLGHVCVLIDDVQFSDKKRMPILRRFVESYPKVRYIISSPYSSATQFGAFVDPEMPIRFEFLEIRELRRNDMRQLLAKEEKCTDVEVWLDRLQDEFKEINLPFTAANGTILIEILSEKYNFSPVNRSVLMEQFVDSTLRKAAVEQSRREIFDYTNKTDLLSYVSAWMAKNDEYIPLREDVRNEVKSYIDSLGLKVDIDELIHEFLMARIFIERADSRLSFRYRGVLEYFISLRMTVDGAFKDWILDESRYLSFINEIQYYAGKLRRDEHLLETVKARHDSIFREVMSEWGDIDLRQLDKVVLPKDDDGKSDAHFDIDFIAPPLTQDEKDAELEAEIPKDVDDRQEVFRPKADIISDRAMLSLFLYSGLIKNMELVRDEDKRRHLSEVWKGWALILISALRIAPRLANERKIRINGALYEISAPHGMSSTTLLRQMMLHLPHAHLRLLSSALGTEKLQKQLSELTPAEESEPKIYRFFRAGVIADLRLPSMVTAVTDFVELAKDSHYLLRAFIIHLGHLRRLDRVKEHDYRKLEEPIATSIAQIKGGTQSVQARERSRQLHRLQRERLLVRLKVDQD